MFLVLSFNLGITFLYLESDVWVNNVQSILYIHTYIHVIYVIRIQYSTFNFYWKHLNIYVCYYVLN